MKRILCLLLLLFVFGCGGGGGGDSEDSACADIGLYPKIYNGEDCGGLSDSPVVRLEILTVQSLYGYCTGTMISPSAVLTAAHCIDGALEIKMFFGDASKMHKADAASWKAYPLKNGSIGDIAIVTLKQPVTELPTLPILTSRTLRGDETATIFGYGCDESNATDFLTLRGGYTDITSASENIIYVSFDGHKSNTCMGDSGGPLVVGSGSNAAVAGVTSSGSTKHCGDNDNAFYAALQNHDIVAFIKSLVPDVKTL